MYRDKARYGQDPTQIIRSGPATFNAPLKWTAPRKVFTCSWSDFFIEQADEWRDDAWAIIRKTPHLAYQILTKRPENIFSRLPNDWSDGWSNVWLGVSVESPKYWHRIITLTHTPAKVRFISYEPALEYVDFTPGLSLIDWLISGGESGYNPRPANLDWFRQVRDDCQRFGVAYFHKQHGGNKRIDGVWGGRVLDGKIHNEFPTGELTNG
jgi:protein gp37